MDGDKTPVDAEAVCRVSPARGVVSTLARVRFADRHFEICYRTWGERQTVIFAPPEIGVFR
jgi:hypothetical protein